MRPWAPQRARPTQTASAQTLTPRFHVGRAAPPGFGPGRPARRMASGISARSMWVRRSPRFLYGVRRPSAIHRNRVRRSRPTRSATSSNGAKRSSGGRPRENMRTR